MRRRIREEPGRGWRSRAGRRSTRPSSRSWRPTCRGATSTTGAQSEEAWRRSAASAGDARSPAGRLPRRHAGRRQVRARAGGQGPLLSADPPRLPGRESPPTRFTRRRCSSGSAAPWPRRRRFSTGGWPRCRSGRGPSSSAHPRARTGTGPDQTILPDGPGTLRQEGQESDVLTENWGVPFHVATGGSPFSVAISTVLPSRLGL